MITSALRVRVSWQGEPFIETFCSATRRATLGGSGADLLLPEALLGPGGPWRLEPTPALLVLWVPRGCTGRVELRSGGRTSFAEMARRTGGTGPLQLSFSGVSRILVEGGEVEAELTIVPAEEAVFSPFRRPARWLPAALVLAAALHASCLGLSRHCEEERLLLDFEGDEEHMEKMLVRQRLLRNAIEIERESRGDYSIIPLSPAKAKEELISFRTIWPYYSLNSPFPTGTERIRAERICQFPTTLFDEEPGCLLPWIPLRPAFLPSFSMYFEGNPMPSLFRTRWGLPPPSTFPSGTLLAKSKAEGPSFRYELQMGNNYLELPEFQRAMSQLGRRFSFCYARLAAQTPLTEGHLVLSFAIDRQGSFRNIALVRQGFPEEHPALLADAQDCVEDAAFALRPIQPLLNYERVSLRWTFGPITKPPPPP